MRSIGWEKSHQTASITIPDNLSFWPHRVRNLSPNVSSVHSVKYIVTEVWRKMEAANQPTY